MGVRGLTTYVYYNRELLLKYHTLHDTTLVIDGHSLCYQLLATINCHPAFGGDYDKYAARVRRFFKSLKKCNVSCYVLFDGSTETRKFKTAYSRLRSKIRGASKIDPVTQSSLQLFPLLLRDVFKEVLIEMQIPYTVCEYEADDEIAAMARHLKCPVLSYDSDFFIYNVLYIPFNTLDDEPVRMEVNGSNIYVLKCKIYKVQNLVDLHGGLKEDLLVLFATLLGNDYVQKRMFKKFFSQLKMPKGKAVRNENQRSIHGLLKWLQNENMDSAIAKIIGRMKSNEKRKVFKAIKNGINGYNRKHCRSLKYFNISGDFAEENFIQLPEVEEEGNDSCSEDNEENSSGDDESDDCSTHEVDEQVEECTVQVLPEWYADKIRRNAIPQTYLDFYTNHLEFCCPQAEDYTDEEASLCILSILRYVFDILTDFSQEHFLYISREKDCDYKRLTVGQEQSVPRPLQKNFSELTDEEIKIYFTHFLKQKFSNIDLRDINLLPSNFRLVMLSIFWWVSHCEVPKSFIHTLFLSYIMLDVIDEKTGTFRGQFFFNNKHSKKLAELKKRPDVPVELSNLFLNKKKVLYEDCLLAASVLLEHFEISPEIKKKPKSYDIKKIHKFAQFQCCVQQFNCLNTLCGSDYVNTTYSKFYNGTFVYNVASKLDKHTDSSLFVEQYLKGANTVVMYFKSLCKVYEDYAEQLGLVTLESNVGAKKKRNRRGRNKSSNKTNKSSSFLTEGFDYEVQI